MSALLQAPGTDLEPDGAANDHKLVAQVRRGDDRAFEALYERYHRRIHAYVLGMVKDHQRAEDVTQEVFVSALRRMRATERPIAFKPWAYEIAKNACIDQFRRSKRAEEVSIDADDGLAPADYGRLVSHEPVPDAALVAKQQLDDLCGAFGGLSEAHHEILVLRELEGLSYKQIGEKMGMSRPAVESTLFRARRRLTEEYDELASGQRCQRIQSIIVNASSGRLGARDTRRLARHVAHCQPCRREAFAAGVDSALVTRRTVGRRAIEKVASLFPIPLLLRGRRGSSGADGWVNQLPAFSDHAAAGGAKLAAIAAIVVAGLGAGVGTQVVSDASDGRAGERPAKAADRPASPAGATTPAAAGSSSSGVTDDGSPVDARGPRGDSGPRDARNGAGSDALRKPASSERQANGGQGPGGSGNGGSGDAPTDAVRGPTDAVRGPSGSVNDTVRDHIPTTGTPSAPSVPSTGDTTRGINAPLPPLPTGAAPGQGSADPVGSAGESVGSVIPPIKGTAESLPQPVSGATAPVTNTVESLGGTLPGGG